MDIDTAAEDIKPDDIDLLMKFLSQAKQDLTNGDPISPDKFCGLDG